MNIDARHNVPAGLDVHDGRARHVGPVRHPGLAPRGRLITAAIVCVGMVLGAGAAAQPLSPPIGGNDSGSLGGAGPAVGSGPGYHDPRSAFKPLEDRPGVVAWSLLSSVTTRVEKSRLIPTFPTQVQALNEQKVKVQGFMLPLGPGERQTHFLLTSVPPTCGFCIPAGPEGMIEVLPAKDYGLQHDMRSRLKRVAPTTIYRTLHS
jgi:hypothetical protein